MDEPIFLRQQELATRWRVSARTLEGWRLKGIGPRYVKIGSRTKFGPNVQVYTATHPINYKERSSGLEYAKPITIGEDCWIGGSAVICPGVTIGHRTIIGAGSVVTKDIPSDVFAAGNPCKVIRQLDPEN